MTWVSERRGQLVASGLVAAAFAVAASGISNAWRTARAYGRLPHQSVAVRELAPAATHGVSVMALLLAAQTIPENATYSVVVGQVPPLGGVAQAVPPVFQYWLLPRRFTTTPADAQWIVAYHQSSELLGVPIKREIGLGPDADAVEVEK